MLRRLRVRIAGWVICNAESWRHRLSMWAIGVVDRLATPEERMVIIQRRFNQPTRVMALVVPPEAKVHVVPPEATQIPPGEIQ
jgi:hypothetical protein